MAPCGERERFMHELLTLWGEKVFLAASYSKDYISDKRRTTWSVETVKSNKNKANDSLRRTFSFTFLNSHSVCQSVSAVENGRELSFLTETEQGGIFFNTYAIPIVLVQTREGQEITLFIQAVTKLILLLLIMIIMMSVKTTRPRQPFANHAAHFFLVEQKRGYKASQHKLLILPSCQWPYYRFVSRRGL